jgi:hypothetical protein
VRASALATGRGDLAVKAASASTRIIEIIAGRLGLDDLESAALIKDANNLAFAVARATRKSPAIGHAVARELADIPMTDTEFANNLTALAVATEQKLQIEKKETS